MAVAGRDFFTGDDQEVVSRERAPHTMRGRGVVVGRDHEVEMSRAGSGRHFLRKPPAVGVDRVQVRVAAIPPRAAAADLLRRVLRPERAVVGTEHERHLHLVVQALLGHLVRAEDEVPGAGTNAAGQVPRRGLMGADRELRSKPARPAAKTAAADSRAVLVEDADVAGVAEPARGHRRLVVAVGDGDLLHAAGYAHRQVDEVRSAGLQVAGDGAGTSGTGLGGGEARRGKREGRRGDGTGAQDRPTGEGRG